MTKEQVLIEKLKAKYPCIVEKTFEAIYARAYEYGHAYGYDEVEFHFHELVEFLETIGALPVNPR